MNRMFKLDLETVEILIIENATGFLLGKIYPSLCSISFILTVIHSLIH